VPQIRHNAVNLLQVIAPWAKVISLQVRRDGGIDGCAVVRGDRGMGAWVQHEMSLGVDIQAPRIKLPTTIVQGQVSCYLCKKCIRLDLHNIIQNKFV
jgi:hypothetical protein